MWKSDRHWDQNIWIQLYQSGGIDRSMKPSKTVSFTERSLHINYESREDPRLTHIQQHKKNWTLKQNYVVVWNPTTFTKKHTRSLCKRHRFREFHRAWDPTTQIVPQVYVSTPTGALAGKTEVGTGIFFLDEVCLHNSPYRPRLANF